MLGERKRDRENILPKMDMASSMQLPKMGSGASIKNRGSISNHSSLCFLIVMDM